MIAAAIAAAFAIAALIAWGVRHATRPKPHRHRAPGPPTGPTLREFLAELIAAHRKANGLDPDEPSIENVELWIDGLVEQVPEPAPVPDPGVIHGPHPPARRPQVLTAARTTVRVHVAAIFRAVPVEHLPWLQHGHGYSDATGSFTALSQDPPALHADESFSLTEDEVTAGLAQHAEEWGQ